MKVEIIVCLVGNCCDPIIRTLNSNWKAQRIRCSSLSYHLLRLCVCVCVCVCVQSLSHIWSFVNLRTVAHQVLLSMGFSRQEYWSGLQFPSPGDLLDPGIERCLLQVDSLPPGKPYITLLIPFIRTQTKLPTGRMLDNQVRFVPRTSQSSAPCNSGGLWDHLGSLELTFSLLENEISSMT